MTASIDEYDIFPSQMGMRDVPKIHVDDVEFKPRLLNDQIVVNGTTALTKGDHVIISRKALFAIIDVFDITAEELQQHKLLKSITPGE